MSLSAFEHTPYNTPPEEKEWTPSTPLRASYEPHQLSYDTQGHVEIPLSNLQSDIPEPCLSNNSTTRMANGPSFIVVVVLGAVAIAVILVLILIPISFTSLQYYEMGFKRRRTTGAVDTSKVYNQGLHFVGPDYEFKTFKANAHFEYFSSLSVFNADRLEVKLTVNLQYFLRPHQLHFLHQKYDIHYHPVIKKNAQDALKGAATVFTNREMILERGMIEQALFKAVKERLGGRCCEKGCKENKGKRAEKGQCVLGCKPYSTCSEADFGLFAEVRYFQLHELVTPNSIISHYLKALTLNDDNQREQLRQNAIITRKDTEQLVQQTLNLAEEISQNATAQSGLFRARADAESKSTIEQARSTGLKHLYSELGITTDDEKATFDYLRTLRKSKAANLAVAYNTYISGPSHMGEL